MRNSSFFHRPSSLARRRPYAAPTPAVATQTIDIACPVDRALDFMSDAQQWLPWTMPELLAVQPLPFGQWLLTAASGLRKLRLLPSATLGMLTFELVDPAAGTWAIPVHLLPTANGCRLVVSFCQPAHILAETFEHCMRNALAGLSMFRLVLEQD